MENHYEIHLVNGDDTIEMKFCWLGHNDKYPIYSMMHQFVNGKLERYKDNLSERSIRHQVDYLLAHGWKEVTI